MRYIIALSCILVFSCTSRTIITRKPETKSTRIEPKQVDLNNTVIPRIVNLDSLLCVHISRNDSILMDSQTFNLIPGEQGKQVKACASNSGAILDIVDNFPNDGRKFMKLSVKGNWKSNLLQLQILELRYDKEGVVHVYELLIENSNYIIGKVVSTFSI